MERFEKDLKEKFLKREIAPSEKTRDKFEMLLDNTDKKNRFANSKKIAMMAASVFLLGGLLMYWFRTVVKEQITEPYEAEQQFVKQLDTITKEEEKVLVVEKREENSDKSNKDSFTKRNSGNVSEIIKQEEIVKEEIQQLVQSVHEFKKQEAELHIEQEELMSQSIKVSPQKLLNVIEYEKQIEYLAINSKSMQQIFKELRVKMVNINIEKKNSDAKK